MSMKWDTRLYIIVRDVTDQEQDTNCVGHKRDNETGEIVCHNYAFEKSTGKSNVHNFRNTFLPIKRIDESGWIHKDSGLARYVYHVVYHTVLQIMSAEGHTPSCMDEIKLFLHEFLDRFGCWKQLQISAILSDGHDVWGQTHIGQVLKDFVLNHNYVNLSLIHI